MFQNSVTITLGGNEYKISAASMKASRLWREQFQNELLTLVGALKALGSVQLASDDGEIDLGRIAIAVQHLGPVAFGLFDKAADMLFAYDTALASERDIIEETASDAEVFAALWQVVQLAFPFGSIASLLPSGPVQNGTSAKPHARSGKPTRKR